MSKREYNKIKSMTLEQVKAHYPPKEDDIFDEDYWYKGVYTYGKELYEFGKYSDFSPPKKSMKNFFKNKELMSRYDEYDFYIVAPEFLEYIIESYKSRVAKYYNEMISPFLGVKDNPSEFLNSIKTIYGIRDNKYECDFSKITTEEQTALFKMIEHVRSFRTEWVQLTPYNLQNGDAITTSWKYE